MFIYIFHISSYVVCLRPDSSAKKGLCCMDCGLTNPTSRSLPTSRVATLELLRVSSTLRASCDHSSLSTSVRLLTYLLRMLGGKCLGRLATEVVGHGGNNLSFKAQHIKTYR